MDDSNEKPAGKPLARDGERGDGAERSFEKLADEGDGPDDDNGDGSFVDALPKGVKQRLESLIPEMVKKTFQAGMGAVFSTEEGIRRIAREVSLPKEVAGYLASTAGNTKDEIMRIVAREVREFLQSVNLSEEIARMLTTLSFEIKTEIRFIPNDERYDAVKPDVKARVRLKRNDERMSRRRRRRRRRPRDEEGFGPDEDTSPSGPGEPGDDDVE